MKCSNCGRTETARWYAKSTDKPYCCSCYRKEYVKNNREKALAAQKKANNSETSRKARKEYETSDKWRKRRRQLDKELYWKDPEAAKARKAKYANPEYGKKHYRENKPAYTEKAARRRKGVRLASLKGKYREDTIKVYAECPKGYEVDHIIPIKGYDYIDGKRQHVVCGLHVHWNLKAIPKAENRTKSCNLYYKSSEEIP